MSEEFKDAGSQPVAMKGRHFQEDGVWVYLMAQGQSYTVKMTSEDFKKAVTGQMFSAYHVLMAGPDKGQPIYLPAIAGTLEPWCMSGSQFTAIAMMHPRIAATLDDAVKRQLSTVQIANSAEASAEVRQAAQMQRNFKLIT